MTDISSLLTPSFRADMAAIAERDRLLMRARREIWLSRMARQSGDRSLAAMCLDFAADAREELAKIGRES